MHDPASSEAVISNWWIGKTLLVDSNNLENSKAVISNWGIGKTLLVNHSTVYSIHSPLKGTPLWAKSTEALGLSLHIMYICGSRVQCLAFFVVSVTIKPV